MNSLGTRLDRLIDAIPWVLGVICGGVALHLVAVLTLPIFAPESAYRKFARPAPIGQKQMLPRAAPSNAGPTFADPFAALAICRFDLAQGPMRLRATADGEHPLSVSVRLADETIIYSAGDRQTPNGRFNIMIVTQAQADAQDLARENSEDDNAVDAAANQSASPAEDELRLIAPGKTGFAVFRVLSLREGDYEAAAARLEAVECSVGKPAP